MAAGAAKVRDENLGIPHQEVGQFYVGMDDALGVDVSHGGEALAREVQHNLI